MATPIPVPMPIPMHHTRDCIIHEGIRYCESTDISGMVLGWILLGILAILLWLAFWFWLAERMEIQWGIDSIVILIGGGIGLPLLIGGLALILWG